jgi:DNA-nicking Smr family endonuclease
MPASPAKHALEDLKKLLDAQSPAKSAPQGLKGSIAPKIATSSAKSVNAFTQFITLAPLKPDFFLTTTDRKLFAKAVEDVAPLIDRAPRVRQRKKPLPIPLQHIADEKAALLQANTALNPSPMSWDMGVDLEEDQSYLKTGANPDLLRKLRRGMWVIQGELDLHHHTQDEAHGAMSEFLAVAKKREWRCVRIIHGKGLTSVRKEPVLRGKVRRWLQMRNDIMAFCEPKPNGGGSGAVLVLLDQV